MKQQLQRLLDILTEKVVRSPFSLDGEHLFLAVDGLRRLNAQVW